jgi:FKBP-type peptidyl-prolyl cis-trans isomerase SlyD
VTLDYTVFDSTDTLLDSGATPLTYLHGGYGELFEKIEEVLEGKRIGESIHLQLSPKDSFGEYKEELVLIEDRNAFEDDIEVGQHVEMVFDEEDSNAMMVTYTIADIHEDRVVLDANHPLAGLTIIFDATVIGIREATHEEVDAKL